MNVMVENLGAGKDNHQYKSVAPTDVTLTKCLVITWCLFITAWLMLNLVNNCIHLVHYGYVSFIVNRPRVLQKSSTLFYLGPSNNVPKFHSLLDVRGKLKFVSGHGNGKYET